MKKNKLAATNDYWSLLIIIIDLTNVFMIN